MRFLEKYLKCVSAAAACCVTQNKKTPLHMAASNGKVEVCLILLKSGADVEAIDSVSVVQEVFNRCYWVSGGFVSFI